MRLIRSNKQCTIVSAAMLLDMEVEDIIQRLGHDGTTVVFPELPLPQNQCGVHIQELIDVFIKYSYGLMPIDAVPCSTTDGQNQFDVFTATAAERRFNRALSLWDGLVSGETIRGIGHTCAWNFREQRLYDPRGFVRKLEAASDFKIRVFWAKILLH